MIKVSMDTSVRDTASKRSVQETYETFPITIDGGLLGNPGAGKMHRPVTALWEFLRQNWERR